jgi:hypothetical protein
MVRSAPSARAARNIRGGFTAAALLITALAGCGSSPPVDMYFGTDVGADFRAPVTDGSAGDTNVTPGTGGTAGGGAGGGAGQSGAAGQSGGTDAGASDAAGQGG